MDQQMFYLEKLIFLLLMFVGGALYIGLREDITRDKIQAFLQKRVRALGFVLLAIVLILALYGEFSGGYYENRFAAHLNHSIYVKIPLALLCGALVIEFVLLAKDATMTGVSLALRSVPFVVLFLTGFFLEDLRGGFRQLTRIEAAGVVLDLSRPPETPTEKKLIQTTTDQETEELRTPFQLGLSILQEAVDKLGKDKSRITSWCNRHPALSCDAPGAPTSKQNAETNGDKIGTQDLDTKSPISPSLKEALDEATGYMAWVKPFQVCLSNKYVEYFPNGLPIQDELSEFAASYTADFPASGDKTEANAQLVGYETERNNLLGKLDQFSRYVEQYDNNDKTETAAKCKTNDIKRAINYLQADEQKNSKKPALNDESEKRHFNLPHNSILEASMIAASGYPFEAARHLEREYNRFTSKKSRRHFGIKEGDFHDFILRLRMLSPLEGLFGYLQDRENQVHYAQIAVRQMEMQFNNLAAHISEDAKTFSPEHPSDFVKRCGNGPLVRAVDITPLPGEEMEQPERQALAQELDEYFRTYTQSYLQTYARLLTAAAHDPNALDNDGTFDFLVRVSRDLATLADDSSASLISCLRPTREGDIQDVLDKLRFDIIAAYSLLLARQWDRSQIDPDFALEVDFEFRSEKLCAVRREISKAWRLGKSKRKGTPLVDESDNVMVEIRQILKQINRIQPTCVS